MSFNRLTEILNLVRKKHPALDRRIQESEALGRWEQAVGPIIAKHARALKVEEKVLWVEVEHPIWKSELHHRKRQILDILNGKLTATGKPELGVLEDILFLDPRKKREWEK